MALYEVTFLLRPDISQKDVEANITELSKEITNAKGSIVKQEYWGLLSLEHKVKKSSKSHFVFLGIDSESDAMNEMSRKARLHENVLRQLTVKVDAIDEELSPILRPDEEDEDAAKK